MAQTIQMDKMKYTVMRVGRNVYQREKRGLRITTTRPYNKGVEPQRQVVKTKVI